mmetsp:Transcript_149615/g.417028  ORF Transcript_149615/g.417028 Transcript_149615/m.417028 type:complete len:374 (-) Transcript_149615:257-1378(-)
MAKQAKEGGLRTYIILDVDGVLNVSARVLSGAPLLFSASNVLCAQTLAQGTPPPEEEEGVEKILSINGRKLGHGEEGTYSEVATPGDTQTVPLFVRRLARLVRASGPQCKVVLSSSWRLEKHQGPVKRLEQEISSCLGEDFTFKAKTARRDDGTPAKRLSCIGDYIHGLSTSSKGDRVRVLVLDDFFASELQGLHLGCAEIDSVEAAEQYLWGRSRAPDKISVRLVQPFDEWVTPTGRRVQIGAGLTMEHFCRAMLFLDMDAGCGCCHAGGFQRRSRRATTTPASEVQGQMCGSRCWSKGHRGSVSDASTADDGEAPEEWVSECSPEEKIVPKMVTLPEAARIEEDAASVVEEAPQDGLLASDLLLVAPERSV